MAIALTQIRHNCMALGATLIKKSKLINNRCVLLAERVLPHKTEYVTWAAKYQHGDIDFYWGHYFDKKQDAEEDFNKRLQEV